MCAPASSSLCQHRVQRLRPRALGRDLAAGDRAGDEEGAGLDAVGQHFVVRAVQALDAFDDQRRGAGALDLRAHRVEAIGEVDDLGFLRGVLDDRGALRRAPRPS